MKPKNTPHQNSTSVFELDISKTSWVVRFNAANSLTAAIYKLAKCVVVGSIQNNNFTIALATFSLLLMIIGMIIERNHSRNIFYNPQKNDSITCEAANITSATILKAELGVDSDQKDHVDFVSEKQEIT